MFCFPFEQHATSLAKIDRWSINTHVVAFLLLCLFFIRWDKARTASRDSRDLCIVVAFFALWNCRESGTHDFISSKYYIHCSQHERRQPIWSLSGMHSPRYWMDYIVTFLPLIFWNLVCFLEPLGPSRSEAHCKRRTRRSSRWSRASKSRKCACFLAA